MGASAVTATTCSTWERLREMVRDIVWPTAKSMPSRILVAKLDAFADTRYGPSGSSSPRKRPSSSVVSSRVKFVPKFVIVTCAFATALPEGSETVPSMAPVLACDCAKDGLGKKSMLAINPQSPAKRMVLIKSPSELLVSPDPMRERNVAHQGLRQQPALRVVAPAISPELC